jgi:hypothetical protein
VLVDLFVEESPNGGVLKVDIHSFSTGNEKFNSVSKARSNILPILSSGVLGGRHFPVYLGNAVSADTSP